MSSRLLGSTESLSIPDRLLPEAASVMLPALCSQDLIQIKEAGWTRVGIVAAVVDEQNRLLMLSHKPSDKSPDGALGPLAETAQVSSSGDRIHVESTRHTLSRAIFEELGIDEPGSLGLTARRLGAWAINDWPVGISYEGQRALAVCPVVHIGQEEREMLQDTFGETEEITGISFVSADDIKHLGIVRPGTQEWLDDVMASELTNTPYGDRAPVELPEPTPLVAAVDIKFGNITFL